VSGPEFTGLEFFEVPFSPDDGLPQAVSCPVGPKTYEFAVYASLDVPADDPLDTIYDLSWPGTAPGRVGTPRGHLVLRVAETGAAGGRVLLLRKLVPEPGLVHPAGPLAVTLHEARIAHGNLNGAGRYGSRIRLGVARRWV
jgi:hypothetical protein